MQRWLSLVINVAGSFQRVPLKWGTLSRHCFPLVSVIEESSARCLKDWMPVGIDRLDWRGKKEKREFFGARSRATDGTSCLRKVESGRRRAVGNDVRAGTAEGGCRCRGNASFRPTPSDRFRRATGTLSAIERTAASLPPSVFRGPFPLGATRENNGSHPSDGRRLRYSCLLRSVRNDVPAVTLSLPPATNPSRMFDCRKYFLLLLCSTVPSVMRRWSSWLRESGLHFGSTLLPSIDVSYRRSSRRTARSSRPDAYEPAPHGRIAISMDASGFGAFACRAFPYVSPE